MAGMIRRLFRLRCRAVLGRGHLVFSLRGPDRLNPDGTITDGSEFAVYGSDLCGRRRWHRGDHLSSSPTSTSTKGTT